MLDLREAIRDVAAQYAPMTVRQVFYQLVCRGIIPKTEQSYKTICRLLVLMRRRGHIPFGWIADNTRWQRKPRAFESLQDALEFTKDTYRRAIWADQGAYVEVWLEKEALAGVLVEVTAEWDVPLMVTRGYPSVSFLHSAGEAIAQQTKPVYVYYFGDRDPSGVDIDRFVEQELRAYAPGIDLRFERVAVLPEQIDSLGLQTRPTKRSDSRSKNFRGESVEVDAIDPDTLREICEQSILKHIDEGALERTRAVEAAEAETLNTIAASLASSVVTSE